MNRDGYVRFYEELAKALGDPLGTGLPRAERHLEDLRAELRVAELALERVRAEVAAETKGLR